jgi:hypothetical protein
MASVCGSTLALMDAGVPISKPVSGIAMGLMVDKADNSRYVVLSDIMDAEDFPSHETAKADFPQDVPQPDLPHQETLANQNFSKTMKKIPYEGPDEN